MNVVINVGARCVYLGSMNAPLPAELHAPLVVLVPAFDEQDRVSVERSMAAILETHKRSATPLR